MPGPLSRTSTRTAAVVAATRDTTTRPRHPDGSNGVERVVDEVRPGLIQVAGIGAEARQRHVELALERRRRARESGWRRARSSRRVPRGDRRRSCRGRDRGSCSPSRRRTISATRVPARSADVKRLSSANPDSSQRSAARTRGVRQPGRRRLEVGDVEARVDEGRGVRPWLGEADAAEPRVHRVQAIAAQRAGQARARARGRWPERGKTRQRLRRRAAAHELDHELGRGGGGAAPLPRTR